MKTLKRIIRRAVRRAVLAVALVAFLAFTLSAWAGPQDVYVARVMMNLMGATTNIAGATATNVNLGMDVSLQKTVTVSITSAYAQAGVDKLIYYFQRSADGVHWDFPLTSLAGQAVGITGTGVTPLTVFTNLDTMGLGFMRLAWITNAGLANSSDCTNNFIVFGIKPNSP